MSRQDYYCYYHYYAYSTTLLFYYFGVSGGCPASLVLHWEQEVTKFFPGPAPLLTPLRFEPKTMATTSRRLVSGRELYRGQVRQQGPGQ